MINPSTCTCTWPIEIWSLKNVNKSTLIENTAKVSWISISSKNFMIFDRERESRKVLLKFENCWDSYSYSSSYPWSTHLIHNTSCFLRSISSFTWSTSWNSWTFWDQKVSENLGKSRKISESPGKFQLTVMHLAFLSRFFRFWLICERSQQPPEASLA